MASTESDMTSCDVCLEKFTDPQKLPCDHTFCKTCVDHIKTRATIKCPSCRLVCHNDRIRPDFKLNKFLEVLSRKDKELTLEKQRTVKEEKGPSSAWGQPQHKKIVGLIKNHCKAVESCKRNITEVGQNEAIALAMCQKFREDYHEDIDQCFDKLTAQILEFSEDTVQTINCQIDQNEEDIREMTEIKINIERTTRGNDELLRRADTFINSVSQPRSYSQVPTVGICQNELWKITLPAELLFPESDSVSTHGESQLGAGSPLPFVPYQQAPPSNTKESCSATPYPISPTQKFMSQQWKQQDS